ncbi:MAG: hypothetical protein OHK0023_12020 [Anaerolineae bacterium]
MFGSTGGGSRVSVRFYAESDNRYRVHDGVEMLPHRSSNRSPQPAIEEDGQFKLDLVTRPGIKFSADFIRILGVWLLLGGIGKRSRRMFGAFDFQWLEHQNITQTLGISRIRTPDELANAITTVLKKAVGEQPPAMQNIPAYPTLHPAHSRVVVGRRGYDDGKAVMTSLFQDLLRTDTYRAQEKSFGQAMGGRRASPLIAQVRKIDGKFYPVLTAMRAKPDQNIRWEVVSRFMQNAKHLWNGIEAWGTL